MATYTYEVFDLLTGLIRAQLPLRCTELPESLNNFDQCKMGLDLEDVSKLPIDWAQAILERRTGVIALRDDQVVWSGIIWSVDTARNGLGVDLTCISLVGFFAFQTLDIDMPFTQVDQHTIVRQLGQYIETQSGGDLNIVWGTDLSGTLRDRLEYFGTEHKTILELWRQLADVIGGVDFRIRTNKISGSQVEHVFQVGSPLGLPASLSGFIFEYLDEPNGRGGNIEAYSVSRPGGFNAVWCLGAGEGSDMVQVLVEDTTLLGSGFGRVTRVISRKSVSTPEVLVEHAEAELVKARQTIPTITVAGDREPAIGTYQIGDFAQIRIVSPEFPRGADGLPGYIASVRIYKRIINPDTDRVSLVLQPLESPEES